MAVGNTWIYEATPARGRGEWLDTFKIVGWHFDPGGIWWDFEIHDGKLISSFSLMERNDSIFKWFTFAGDPPLKLFGLMYFEHTTADTVKYSSPTDLLALSTSNVVRTNSTYQTPFATIVDHVEYVEQVNEMAVHIVPGLGIVGAENYLDRESVLEPFFVNLRLRSCKITE